MSDFVDSMPVVPLTYVYYFGVVSMTFCALLMSWGWHLFFPNWTCALPPLSSSSIPINICVSSSTMHLFYAFYSAVYMFGVFCRGAPLAAPRLRGGRSGRLG